MNTKSKHPLVLALVAAAAAALPAAAQTNQSDILIYTPAGINMTLVERPTGPEFVPAFAPVPNLPDQAVLLLEQGSSAANPIISDAIWIQAGFLYFESDGDIAGANPVPDFPTTIPIVGSLFETGQLQDIGVLMQSPSGAPAFAPGTLLVLSDVETPEPSTLALLGVGTIGAMTFLRRRKA